MMIVGKLHLESITKTSAKGRLVVVVDYKGTGTAKHPHPGSIMRGTRAASHPYPVSIISGRGAASHPDRDGSGQPSLF